MERNKLAGDDFDLEKAYRDNLALQKWGKDAPWYLSEERVGDVPYRYQGLALHGGLAALGLALRQPIITAAQIPFLANAIANERWVRPKIGESGVPVLKDQPY